MQDARREGDGEVSHFAARGTTRIAHSPLCQRDDLTRASEELRSCLGQAQLSIGAVDQLRAHLSLELPDLLAERGLRDTQPSGRAPEVQLFRDGDEIVVCQNSNPRLDDGQAACEP